MNVYDLKIVHGILNSVYRDREFSNIALNNAVKSERNCDIPSITHMVYGVLKYDIQLQYLIDILTPKPPKSSVMVLLKMGVFALRYTKTPSYATINNCVNLAKIIYKGGVNNFVNAILRKSIQVQLPELNKSTHSLSINYSYPEWLIQLMISNHGIDDAIQFLKYEPIYKTHIRHNNLTTTKDELYDKLIQYGEVHKSSLGLYVYAVHLNNCSKNLYAIQSLASMIVIQALGQNLYCNALDLCAAPGGKSVYFVHNNPDSNIVSCDIHAHKLPLISNYAKSMGVDNKVRVLYNDATVYHRHFDAACDIVLCDVPGSGLGMVYSKHEIVLTITLQDIQQLAVIQSKILSNAAHYVKHGGLILYSTCTITKLENDAVVRQFLDTHSDFEILTVDNQYINSDEDGCIRLWPYVHHTDGFFAAVLHKKHE